MKLAEQIQEYAQAKGDSPHPPDEDLKKKETREQVDRGINNLSVKLRETVLLYYFEGRSVSEVANALCISEPTVRKRLQYARDRLHTFMTAELESALESARPGKRFKHHVIALIPGGSVAGKLGLPVISTAGAGSLVESARNLVSLGGFVMSAKQVVIGLFVVAAIVGLILSLQPGPEQVPLPEPLIAQQEEVEEPPPLPVVGDSREDITEVPPTPSDTPSPEDEGLNLAVSTDGTIKEGEDLLDAWRRLEADKAMEELTELYGLEEGQDLKFISPPFLPARMKYYKAKNPGQAELIPEGPNTFIFSWGEDGMKQWAAGFGRGGSPLRTILRTVAKIPSQEIEADPEILDTTIYGDFVYREDVPVEVVIEDLELILNQELGIEVTMEFRDVEEDVFVARGEYEFASASDAGERDMILVHAFSPEGLGGSGRGDFGEFLVMAGRSVDIELINEVSVPPEDAVNWDILADSHGDWDPLVVLQNITDQTGIIFTQETRTTRRLFIEYAQ